MRKKDWLKFLRIIFYFLAIISLALSIMGRMAKAESAYLPSEFYVMLEEDCIRYNVNYNYIITVTDYLNRNKDDISFLYCRESDFTFIILEYNYDNVKYGFQCDYNNMFDLNSNSALYTGFMNTRQYSFAYYGSYNISDVRFFNSIIILSDNYYYINGNFNNGNMDVYSYNWSTYNVFEDDYSNTGITFNGYFGDTYNYTQGYSTSSRTIHFDNAICYKGIAFYSSIDQNNTDWKLINFTDNWEIYFPSAVADSRLKFDTIISSGRKELVVDMSAFCDDLLASSYNISDFVLTLKYDGVEQTFDDLGEYISIYASSTGWDCFAIVPYSEFGFDDNNNISDISVSVTKVSFSTNELYPNRPTVTESYQIATSYYLKNDLDNNIDWDDTNITENPNETIQYDGDDFNDLKISLENPEMQDHGTIYNDWHYVSSLPVWEGWESIYNVDIFTFADALDVEHTWYHVRADFDSSLVQQFGIYYYVPFKISNWLYDNAISNYYDVLVFKNYHGKYEDVDITAPDDYLIFYSNRYYLKKHILELGNVHKTVSSIGNQIYTLYDFTYKRMNDINGNIQKGFENVLSKDTAILGLLSSVNFNLDKFGNMINSNLVSVVSGINGLKGSDDRDLTDIYNRLGNMVTSVDLTGILTNLFVPTYNGFQDSFDDAIDSMGILALPFDVSKRFIIASRVPYSSTLNVTFPEYEFNNLQYWDEYEFEFNPNSILSADWLEFLQYCNALFVIITVTLLTYKHIFASPVSEESGIL